MNGKNGPCMGTGCDGKGGGGGKGCDGKGKDGKGGGKSKDGKGGVKGCDGKCAKDGGGAGKGGDAKGKDGFHTESATFKAPSMGMAPDMAMGVSAKASSMCKGNGTGAAPY